MKLEQLETIGYLSIAYPAPLKRVVQETAEAWEMFCALPEESKLLFSYTADVSVGSGVGYELKKGGGGLDFKEDFHIRANRRDFLLKEARKVGWIAEEFVRSALNINTHLLPPILEFARALEKKYGLRGFEKDVKDAMRFWTLRFLHYFPSGDDSAILASHHIDKGGFTPHLWETATGLERLTFDPYSEERRWESMPVGHDEMIIFSGLRMQLRSKNELKATCHQVVANEETAKKGRYSAVAFIDFLNTPYYDKERCGRTQDFKLGATYDMPFSEFEKMFVQAAPTSAY